MTCMNNLPAGTLQLYCYNSYINYYSIEQVSLRLNFFENYIAFTRCHALLFFSLGHLHFILLLFIDFLGLNFLDLFNLKHTVRTIQLYTSLILYFVGRIEMGKTNEMIFCVFSCLIKMLCIGYQHFYIKSCLIQKQLFVVISQGLHINILFVTCT